MGGASGSGAWRQPRWVMRAWPPTRPCTHLHLCGTPHRWALHLQRRGPGSPRLSLGSLLSPPARTEPAGGWQDWKWGGRPGRGGHSPAGPARQSAARASRARTVTCLMAGLSCLWVSVRSCRGCCWTSAGRSASHGRQRGLYPGCAAGEGGPTVSWAGHGGSARAVWESSAPALRAKPQRMLWLEPELPGQARRPGRVHPKPPAPAGPGQGEATQQP